MSEAERIAEKTYPPNEARAYLDGYNAAIRAQEQNEPLTCDGCGYFPNQHDGRGCLNKNCWDCARLNNRSDRYKPKGERE